MQTELFKEGHQPPAKKSKPAPKKKPEAKETPVKTEQKEAPKKPLSRLEQLRQSQKQ